MLLLRVLVVVLLAAVRAKSQAIIFPGQLDHAEGEECNTHSGKTGTCERSCGHSPTRPSRCGIKDSAFLVCCDKTKVRNPGRVTDITPPAVKFECGRNIKNQFTLNRRVGFEPQPLPPALSGRPAGGDGEPSEFGISSFRDSVSAFPGFAGGTSSIQAVGGVPAVKNAWPWMALVGRQDGLGITWFCAGVLINEQWVLSALHCFLSQNATVVRLGEHDYNDLKDGAAHKDFGVAEIVFYPDYNHPEAYHDLALLRLEPKVTIQRFISPVCLPWGEESDKEITSKQATLTGWGDTKFGGMPSSILQEVNVTVFPPGQCDSSYSNLPHYSSTWPRGIGQETLCAGDPAGGRDACQGDSGGPLVSQDARERFVLAGIVSRGYGCGHKDYPGLYANVRHPPYLAWVKKVAFATQ